MKTNQTSSALVWLRLDLRTRDNEALAKACASGAPVVALFVVSPNEWKIHNVAPIKIDFILRNLPPLAAALRAINVPLVIRTAQTIKDVQPLVCDVATAIGARSVYWNAEHEVDESRRDAALAASLTASGINVVIGESQLVLPPNEISTGAGKKFTVFTPFKKRCIAHLADRPSLLRSLPTPPPVTAKLPDNVRTYVQKHAHIPTDLPAGFDLDPALRAHAAKAWPAGEDAAEERLATFIAQRSATYKDTRDFFGNEQGTSRISTYLASGIISGRECIRRACAANGGRLDSGNPGLVHWISELLWREFYRHVLIAYPRVCMNRAFKPETEAVQWSYDHDAFQRWCTGNTGFPIVDAGMRYLNTYGYMHNRLRMVVAMFLTKDLLIDWRWGEKYFMEHLIDGDFASNNGGWQWSASTGTDSQPYFRVFNPLLQSQKFDSTGDFIRANVPELAKVKAPAIHEPYTSLTKSEFAKLGYPSPIVNHSEARIRCVAAFKNLSPAAAAEFAAEKSDQDKKPVSLKRPMKQPSSQSISVKDFLNKSRK